MFLKILKKEENGNCDQKMLLFKCVIISLYYFISTLGYSSTSNDFIVNPTRKEMSESFLNLVVAGTKNKLTVMLEAEASNLDKSLFLEAIQCGLNSCQLIANAIAQEAVKHGKPKRPISQSSSK